MTVVVVTSGGGPLLFVPTLDLLDVSGTCSQLMGFVFGSFCIWKRKHVTLVAILPPWQQPTLSYGRCCRRQRWKETESPVITVGCWIKPPLKLALPSVFQLCKATIPFYSLSHLELGVLLHGTKSILSDTGKDHVYLFHRCISKTWHSMQYKVDKTKIYFWVNKQTSIAHSCFPSRLNNHSTFKKLSWFVREHGSYRSVC